MTLIDHVDVLGREPALRRAPHQARRRRIREPAVLVGRPLHRRAHRRADRRRRGSRPCRSPRRRTAPGCRAARTAGCRPCGCGAGRPPSIDGRRRTMPRPYTCISGSGPNASNTSWRSASVSLSRVSSSWLRTKLAHCDSAGSGGRSRSAFASGRGILPRERQVERLHPDEVELHRQLRSPSSLPPKYSNCSGVRQVHLAEQDGVARAALQEPPQVLQVVVRVAAHARRAGR